MSTRSFDSIRIISTAETPSSIYHTTPISSSAKIAVFRIHSFASDSAGVVTAVNRGGDTDTIGGIAGAVAGARFGASDLPHRWLSAIDETNELNALADQLAELA